MRSIMILACAAALSAPVMAQQRERDMSAEERARLEARLDQLRTEMRELERQLGRTNRLFLRSDDGEPFAWRLGVPGRARLGVIVATAPSDTDQQGARLEAVTPNGPAAQAGLRAGDIITRVNGVALANTRPSPGQRLIDEVDDLDDGDTVRVEYRRGNDTGRASIVARTNAAFGYSYNFGGDGPMEFSFRMDSFRLRLDSLRPRLFAMGDAAGALNRALVEVREMPGLHSSIFTSRWSSMELTTLDADLGRYFGTTEGVLVVRAPRDSLLGLKSGDVIRRIGGRVPTSPSHAVRILRSYEPGDQIRIEIMRNQRAQTLNATVPAASEDRGLFWEWDRP